MEKLYAKERAATYESYKKYQQSYYPEWKPEYEQFVKAQAEPLRKPGFDSIAWVNAVTYQMIYEQPVIYEIKNITVPTLLIIGDADRTIAGKNLLSDSVKAVHGLYPQLAQQVKEKITGCRLIMTAGVGHIPHIQEPEKFKEALNSFLQ